MKFLYRERERTAHMVNELIGYFQHYGIVNFSLHVLQDDTRTLVEIFGACKTPPPHLDELQESLNKGRAPAMEEYYDQLMSIYDENSELHLLAMMVDRGLISYGNEMLSISIERFL